MTVIEKFNNKKHRYITRVLVNDGYIIIHGKIGMRWFLYHNLREATIKYNKEVKKLLDNTKNI